MIEYDTIIQQFDAERAKALLSKLNIPFRDNGAQLILPTVCHNVSEESASWKLYFYKDSHLFHCFTECGETFSVFKFLEKYYKIRNLNYDWYEDVYLLITDGLNIDHLQFNSQVYKKIEYTKRVDIPCLPEIDNKILQCFDKYYPIEWLQDGITPKAMDKYNILYSISQNKIIIPHYDKDDRLVGIRGRALNSEECAMHGKYAPLIFNGLIYNHPLGLNLYGLNFNKNNIRKAGYCFVGEGEKFIYQLDAFYEHPCAVAVCGSVFSKYQLRLLMETCHPQEVIICFDNEEKQGKLIYFQKLWNMCYPLKNLCNISFVYDKQHLTEYKGSPSDFGKDVFMKLINNRVKVK